MRQTLLWSALYALVALLTVQAPMIEADIWWHLRTGQWIVENRAVPTTDPFSSYGQDKPWMAYSWLFELLAYGLYQQGELVGILVLRVAAALAVTAAVHRLVARREPSAPRGIALTFLAGLALSPILQERPWMFSLIGYVLTLDVVLDVRTGRPNRLTWLLPVVYVIWANVHIQFINGLFLLGLTLGAEVLERIAGRLATEELADWQRNLRRLALLTLACGVATLVNPYGWKLYGTILELPTQTGAFGTLDELRSPPFRDVSDWCILGLTCLTAYSLGGRARVSLFEVLLLATGALFAFRAQRDAWLVVFASLALLTSGCRRPDFQSGLSAPVSAPPRLLRFLGGCAVVALVVTAAVAHQGINQASLEAELAKHYPVAAAAAVEKERYPGPLYNHYNWGGYLIWRLPQLPVSMDGRSYLHGDERMLRSFHTWGGQRNWKNDPHEGWDTDPELAQARLVIAATHMPLVSVLRHDRRFRLVHDDGIAAVFVARSD